ncbi:MAG TPA: TIGR03067 domain-containing protein [Blastocatellia bacterium]|nr:TIGR03067 domain-containing protein [Blastocatellia bacterium]
MKKVIVNNRFGKAIGVLFTSMALVTLGISFSMIGMGGDINNSDNIQGTWLPSAAELAGNPFPEEIRKTIKLVVKDDKYIVTAFQAVDRGEIRLNPTASPKELDITGTEGPNQGKTIHAIYERNGNTLRICYDLTGNGRPTGFATQKGTQLFLITYQLEKP